MREKIRFKKNCDAVTDMIGALLLTGIAVLALSTASVFVLSTYQGAMDNPHVDVDGWVDVSTDKITLRHSGGESIDRDDMSLILEINGETVKLGPEDFNTDGDTWDLGDTIVIDTSTLDITTKDIEEGDNVDATIVHVGSSIVVKSGVLLGGEEGSGSDSDPGDDGEANKTFTPIWAIDTSYTTKGAPGYATVENVSTYGDSSFTTHKMARKTFNDSSYQQFNFSMGLTEVPDSISLLINHNEYDSNSKGTRISVFNSSGWGAYEEMQSTEMWENTTLNLSPYILTLDDINNLKIRYSSWVQGNDNKDSHIDYVAVIIN